jgi:hypothetical protein
MGTAWIGNARHARQLEGRPGVHPGLVATSIIGGGRSSLRVMRLTANFLEMHGLVIADKVHSFMSIRGLLLGGGQ